MNVLEKILEEISEEIRGSLPQRADGLIKAREIIRSHMDEVENDGWIPVEEKPEETGYYLVQLSRKLPNEDYSDRVVVLFNGEEKEFMCYANLIIAWQPLPKQYKPNKQD